MTRISRKVREEAIEACMEDADGLLSDGHRSIESPAASALIDELFVAMPALLGLADIYLEAAALLRGDDEHYPWEPGHAVYLRGAP